MKESRNVYYFDYSPESYNYIMSSRILRQSEKNILKAIVDGKTVKELAVDYKCNKMTICRKRKKIFELTKDLMNYDEPRKKVKKKKIENDNLYKIYMLTFPNNKVYIGMTSLKEKDRWKDGKGYIYNEKMYSDIIKYGWNNVKKNIIFKNLKQQEAREKEKELIIHYKSHLKKYGYNKIF